VALRRHREQELLLGRVLDRKAGAVGDRVLVGIADAQLRTDARAFDAELRLELPGNILNKIICVQEHADRIPRDH
jgi:hypothetical protein